MNPTPEQLAARLNPTPVNINTPSGGGLFRDNGGFGATVFKQNPDGTYSQFDVMKIGREQLQKNMTPDQYGNYNGMPNAGGQAAAGLGYLKDAFGFDYNSLPVYNIADIGAFNGREPGKLTAYNGDAAGFFSSPTTPSTKVSTINDTPNTLSVGQPPSVNLKPGDSGDEVKKLQDFLVSKGIMTQAEVDTGYGTYGPKTKAAVAKLQEKLGVSVGGDAGYYGPKTISALSSGSSSAAPQADGYYEIDGGFYQKNGTSWSPVSDPKTITSLKSGETKATKTSFSSTFGGAVAGSTTADEDAFFNSAEFKALTPDQQSAIHSIFNTIQTNDAPKRDLLQKAIAKATENADPIFKQTLRLSLDALDRGFTDNENDLQYKEKQLTTTLARLKEDAAFSKNNLSIEHQQELKNFEDGLVRQLDTTRQDLAASGFTDSTRRAKSEELLSTTKGNLVESSNRKFAADTRNLDNTANRSAEDTAAEIERLRQVTKSNNLDLGRKTESIVGSGNLGTLPGYEALGNITGTAEQTRQKDIDKATKDYYDMGFVI